jgi:predicted hotdog family 3-hydroxylacyl-ACP dehydratase
MLIDHGTLCELIPHAGDMCLLDEVEEWDEGHIVCLSRSHRNEANPLRSNGILAVVHGIEYAAQAMAVHGGLLAREAGEANPPGFLAAVRNVRFHVERLDDQPESLHVEATELMRGGGSFIYEFTVSAVGKALLDGRLTVMTPQEGR